MSDENAPIDTTAEQAEHIVWAAIAWSKSLGPEPVLNRSEWELFISVEKYGPHYKGLRSR